MIIDDNIHLFFMTLYRLELMPRYYSNLGHGIKTLSDVRARLRQYEVRIDNK